MSKRRTMPIVRAAVVALVAGVLSGYAAPITAREGSAVEHFASRTFRVFESACAFEWDDAPVARATFSIRQ